MIGFTAQTGGPFTGAAAGTPTTTAPVGGVAGPDDSAFVFAGGSTANGAWALPPASGYSTTYDNTTTPDLFVAVNDQTGTSIGSVTPTTFGAGTPKALQIALTPDP